MMKKSMPVFFGLIGLFFFSAGVAQNQGQVQLLLGSVSAAAAEIAAVPVDLSTGTDRQIGQLSFEIQFPKELLSFEEIELAAGLDSTTVELTATPIEQEQDSDLGVVRLNLTGKSVLPSGSVANLVFTINPEVYEDQTVTIKTTVVSAKTAEGGDISEIAISEIGTVDGEIWISGAPLIFGCLFYMH